MVAKIASPPVEDLKRLYLRERLSQEDIAGRYGVGVWVARRWLHEAKIPSRGSNNGRTPKVSHKVVVDAFLDGETEKDIAERFKIGEGAVRNALIVKGVARDRLICRHGDADSSPGYEKAVERVANLLGIRPVLLRKLLVANGIRGYQRWGAGE